MKLFLLWLLTAFSFPLGGLISITLGGTTNAPLTAAFGGLIAGAVIGTAQWLVLRTRNVTPWWIAASAGGLAVGNLAASFGATLFPALAMPAVFGLLAGAILALAQVGFIARTLKAAALWIVAVSGAWTLGWFVTSGVIVDAERGFAVFGISGAIPATAIMGAALTIMKLSRKASSTTPASTAAPSTTTVVAS
jgi:hypothetical protein